MSVYTVVMSSKYINLVQKFHINPESCDNPKYYEQYIQLCAITDQKEGKGVTHLLIQKNDKTKKESAIGFITLRATSFVKKNDNYNEGHSALEIAELAIDQNFERQGFGSILVKFAISIASNLNTKYAGIEYIVLCADPKAENFYYNFNKPNLGFKKITSIYDEIPRDGWNQNCVPMLIKLQ